MSHGTLTLYTGPMFAGKTSALVRDILYQTYFSGPRSRHVGVFRPVFDSRFADPGIVSHEGTRVDACALSSVEPLFDGWDSIFLDEVQFFTPHTYRATCSIQFARCVPRVST